MRLAMPVCWAAFVLLALPCFLSWPAVGAEPCRTGNKAMKVWLNPPPPPSGDTGMKPEDLEDYMRELKFAFENERERRWVEDEGAHVSFEVCIDPSSTNRSEFEQRVRDLYDDQVLLDVAQTLIAKKVDGKI